MKQKSCKICKNKFTPERQMQSVCSYECSLAYANQHLSKSVKEKKKTARAELIKYNQSDVKLRMELAKKIVQKYVRLRDFNDPCISCRKPFAKQWDGGHYMNAQYFSAIRFNTLNIHKQCSHCNDWNNENKQTYRIHLIDKIGLDKVEWLEAQNQTVKYDAEYLNKLIKTFRKKIRRLEARL